MTKRAPVPWSLPVAIHEVPEGGRRFSLSADAQARAAVAAAAGLLSLPRLEAALEVTRHGADGLHVTGTVSATVGQTCVVTLEPMESTVEEPVDVVFASSAVAPEFDEDRSGSVPVRRATTDDAPEPLEGGTVDLGALAVEFLILGVDPYPRKHGATFEAPTVADEGNHPFAALAALRNKGPGKP